MDSNSLDRSKKSMASWSRAERSQFRLNAEKQLNSGTNPQKIKAKQMLDILEAIEKDERQEQVARLKTMNITDLVVEAFTAIPMTETEAKLVKVLLDNPLSTSTELSAALGWGGMTWHMHFGTMCQSREAYLWPAEKVSSKDRNFYSGILADIDDKNRFSMKADVITGFAKLGIIAKR